MPPARPRVALVGAGSMGSLHARVISQSPRCDLARVVDPVERTGRAVANRWGVDWAPELDLSGVDAVVLASATETHHGLALRVLEADLPLLVEKPVCADLAATEEVIALAETRGLPLMCGLVERYNPAVLTALALISDPVHVSAARHSPYAPRIRTGVGWDLLVHDVDLAVRCFGGAQPQRVSSGVGFFHPDSVSGAEDVVETVLGFPGGGLATVSASRIGQRKVRELTIAEVDRSVEVDLLRRAVTIYRHVSGDAADADGRGYRQQTIIEIPELVTAAEPLAAQLDRFLDLVAGTADAAEERASVLPAHRVVSEVLVNSRALSA
ncbi:MAG TPA: Gfo/Idh/MocA family oxidoreductase [Pseudonocardiaceae bacterium]